MKSEFTRVKNVRFWDQIEPGKWELKQVMKRHNTDPSKDVIEVVGALTQEKGGVFAWAPSACRALHLPSHRADGSAPNHGGGESVHQATTSTRARRLIMISLYDQEGTVVFEAGPQMPVMEVLRTPTECWPEVGRYVYEHDGVIRVSSKHLEIYECRFDTGQLDEIGRLMTVIVTPR